jgi:hypothetical protein
MSELIPEKVGEVPQPTAPPRAPRLEPTTLYMKQE